MDFKGIAWAGNLYQKFEAMCLEMEEVMYQDTVTYLENQAQTVGASVKKFYSEVMEDFQPPSCIDPVKVSAADLPLNPYSHTGVIKKPKKSTRDNPKDVETKKIENCGVIADVSFIGELNGVVHSPISDGDFLVNGCSELYSRKRKTGGLYRRPTAISKESSIRFDLSKVSGSSPSLSGSTRRVSSSREIKTEVPSAPVEIFDATEAYDDTRLTEVDASRNSPASDKSLETVTEKQDNSRVSSTTTTELSSEIPGVESGTYDELAPNMESKINTFMCASGGEDGVLTCEGRSHNGDMDVVSNVVDPELEIIERLGESKFEETCVLVEENEVHFASQNTTKHKSYKKKIREAFTSKMRSTRRQEYEKLAAQYNIQAPNLESSAGLITTISEDPNQENLQAQSIGESEWELL